MTEVSAKEELHQRIDAMDERSAVRLLATLSLRDDDGQLSDAELSEIQEALEEVKRGHVVTQAEWEEELETQR